MEDKTFLINVYILINLEGNRTQRDTNDNKDNTLINRITAFVLAKNK